MCALPSSSQNTNGKKAINVAILGERGMRNLYVKKSCQVIPVLSEKQKNKIQGVHPLPSRLSWTKMEKGRHNDIRRGICYNYAKKSLNHSNASPKNQNIKHVSSFISNINSGRWMIKRIGHPYYVKVFTKFSKSKHENLMINQYQNRMHLKLLSHYSLYVYRFLRYHKILLKRCSLRRTTIYHLK